jgi:hypothetical protein
MAGTAAAEPVHDAAVAADRWLALVDAGAYERSWDEAAGYFQGVLPKDQWVSSLQVVRTPLGAVTSRQQHSTQYTTELPGVPDGHYVVLQYGTAFANKRAYAVETVTLTLEADSTWKVSGYYIR